MPEMPASTGVLAGASLKGLVRGLISSFVGDSKIAGLSLADILVILIAYFMYKRASGFARDFATGLFIKSVGDVVEGLIGGGFGSIASALQPQPQVSASRPIVRRVVGVGGGFR